MNLPRPLRALLQRLRDWLAPPVIAAPEEPDDAHRIILAALDRYRRTHAPDDDPRLHISREAWDAILRSNRCYLAETPRTYAGCPVTISDFEGRHGIWCDAMPRYVCGPHAGARAYGSGGVLETPCRVEHRDLMEESARVRAESASLRQRRRARPDFWQAEEEITEEDRRLLRELEAPLAWPDVIGSGGTTASEHGSSIRDACRLAAELDATVAPGREPHDDESVLMRHAKGDFVHSEEWTEADERDLADTAAGCVATPAELADGSDDNESEAEAEEESE